jgi:NAD+ synthase (glutamine-hydrolysing)
MPGFGTSAQSLGAARILMEKLAISSNEADIRQLCMNTFLGIGHKPFGIDITGLSIDQFSQRLQKLDPSERYDLVFENVQARVRTLLLMNAGFVLGTGDLSEQALGWSTYNGDHMSMYNVNASIPKTLVRFLIQYLADNRFSGPVKDCLQQVLAAPITPELLPVGEDGKVVQKTEETIGPYELHDFFLYHLLRFGTSPDKLLYLAGLAKFDHTYSSDQIRQTLVLFLKRFFSNQFKRSCVPDGPKVGSVSLSPRGDWRMPSDAEVTAWLNQLQ